MQMSPPPKKGSPSAPPIIGKVITIILALATVAVGCLGIFSAETSKTYSLIRGMEEQSNTLHTFVSGAPWWKECEGLFITCSLLTFFAAVANLLFTLVVRDPLDKSCEGMLQFFMAILIMFGGCLLLVSATTTKNATYEHLKSGVKVYYAPGQELFGILGGGGGDGKDRPTQQRVETPDPADVLQSFRKGTKKELYSRELDNNFLMKVIGAALAFATGLVLMLLGLLICCLPQRLKKPRKKVGGGMMMPVPSVPETPSEATTTASQMESRGSAGVSMDLSQMQMDKVASDGEVAPQ